LSSICCYLLIVGSSKSLNLLRAISTLESIFASTESIITADSISITVIHECAHVLCYLAIFWFVLVA